MPTQMKNGRWKGYVVVGIRPDGKPDRRYAYDSTEAKVSRKLGAIKADYERGLLINPKNITVGEWATQWIESYKSGKEMNTQRMYTEALEIYILPKFRYVKLKDVKHIHIQQFLNELISPQLDEGVRIRIVKPLLPDGESIPPALLAKKFLRVKQVEEIDGKDHVYVSGLDDPIPADNIEVLKRTRSVEMVYLTLNQMFKKAINPGRLINENPCEGVELPGVTASKKRAKLLKRSLTHTENIAMRNAEYTLRERVFVQLLLDTGMRRGELFALSKSDIDIDGNRIVVDKAVVWEKNKPQAKPVPKAPASVRKMPMTTGLKLVLQDYLQTLGPYDYLFGDDNGALLTRSAVQSLFRKVINKANKQAGGTPTIRVIGSDVSMHTFRHTYATMLFYAGVNMKRAQYLLGHETLEMTLALYTHLMNETQGEDEKKIDSYITESFNKIKQS